MSRVSVIMGIYNCEETLAEAIDSILNQSFTDWHLIICDDCSEDNSLQIAKEYQSKYPDKIKLIRNEHNSKLSFTLNHCLKYATGDYIARMDGDDISLPDRFLKQVNFLDNHPDISVVSAAMIPFDEQGDHGIRKNIDYPDKYSLLTNPCFNHATIMMRKSVFDSLNGYTVSKRTERGQDYDLWFRFFASDFRGYNMQEPLYKVREVNETYKRRTFRSRLYLMQTMFFGYKLLKYPFWSYINILKPLITGMIPVSILNYYRKYKDNASQIAAR